MKQHFPERAAELLPGFQLYLDELYAINAQVNLVSRQMVKEDYWQYHFLDSLLIFKCMDLVGGKALDFGTGGGLPGIPVKLVRPEMDMTLLDSVGKKAKCLDHIIDALRLKNCSAVWSRLEDYAKAMPGNRFDYILCRSVRMEPAFFEPMFKLLKSDGKAIFYKAHQAEDVTVLPGIKVFDVSREELGKRQIIIAPKRSFEMYLKNRKLG